MRAAVFHGPHDVRVETVPDPGAPPRDEVVLEVLRAAICGTDAAEWDHGPVLCRTGVVLGHEFVGRVLVVGEGVTAPARRRPGGLGRRHLVRALLVVSSGSHEPVRRVPYARPSGRRRPRRVRDLPGAICRLVPEACDDDAAAMTQPLAVALHALSRVAQAPDESVAVIGAGGIGSFIIAAASSRAIDGRVVAIDVDADRLPAAASLGADETAAAAGRELSELLLDLSDGDGFDVVIEASGAPVAPAAAIRGARRGGRVLLVGLHGAPRELDLTGMIVREVDIFTTVAHVCDVDIPAALQLLAATDVAAVTAGARIPLESLVEDGLRPLAERRAPGKILVTP